MNIRTLFIQVFIALLCIQYLEADQHSLIAPYFTSNFNLALLAIEKLDISPSRSLCRELGKVQCEDGCCPVKGEGYHTLRQFSKDQRNGTNIKTPSGHLSEEQLCILSGRSFCKGTCCLDGNCYESDRNATHLTFVEQQCNSEQPTNQQLCQRAGLLWCFNECCGFSSTRHKCYKRNLYGLPYIRCPIQPSQQEL